MIYFANPTTGLVPEAIDRGLLGAITTPVQGNRIRETWDWCADNGCFGKGYPGDTAWLAWLDSMKPLAARCKFATAPDVVGDADATLKRSLPLLPEIRKRGYPGAFVGQNGLESLPVPWDEFDAFFIGGSTEWKLGREARQLVIQARQHSKWIHMGRVNSFRRLKYAADIGCHSVDGTYLIFGPDVNLPRLLRWLEIVNLQPMEAVA